MDNERLEVRLLHGSPISILGLQSPFTFSYIPIVCAYAETTSMPSCPLSSHSGHDGWTPFCTHRLALLSPLPQSTNPLVAGILVPRNTFKSLGLGLYSISHPPLSPGSTWLLIPLSTVVRSSVKMFTTAFFSLLLPVFASAQIYGPAPGGNSGGTTTSAAAATAPSAPASTSGQINVSPQ